MTMYPTQRGRALRILLLVLAIFVLAIGLGVASVWAPDRAVSELSARWAPPPSQFVTVEGMQVHLRDEGPRDDPQPIVLLHGTSSSLHTWDAWARELGKSRRVIRFDLPAFGLTGPSPDRDYSLARYRRFVTAMYDHLKISHSVLGGNSLGGAIAWQTALTMPQRVDALILVDAAGYLLTPKSVPIGFRLASMPALAPLFTRILPRGVIESSVRNVYGDPSRVTPELVDRYFELTLRQGNRSALADRFKSTVWGAGSERIKEIRQPTLILWGGRDMLIPPEHAEQFKRDIPGSTLQLFPALGHVPQEEDGAQTVAAVLPFLASLPGH